MPLRWKLVALYALILAGVIGGLSAILVVQVRRALRGAVDVEIEARARALSTVVDLESGVWKVEPGSGVEREYTAEHGLYYYVREMDEKKTIILSSPLAHSLWPAGGPGLEDVFGPEGAEIHNGVEIVQYPRTTDRWIQGRHYRETGVSITKTNEDPSAEELAPDGSSRSGRPHSIVVHCGKDLSPIDGTIDDLVGGFLFLGPVVLLASLAGGFFLASRALRPIEQMAHTARGINETDLSRRIPVRTRDELGRLGDALNAAFDRVQKGFDRERRFTADASHELRTPLSVVTGNVEVALNKDRSAPEYKEILADIGEAAARMQAIVEGLLSLARADSKAVALAHEPVALAPLCHETMKLSRHLAEERHVTVDVTGDEGIAANGDREQLKELVSNLVTNAIRYNRDGGKVTIDLARMNGKARLRVDDTGIGIPAKDLPHVFERFYRVDEARSSEKGGVGLGLAIAKWIAEAHGGSIRVESQPGIGTRFEVLLPV